MIRDVNDLKWAYFRNVKQNFVTTYRGTVFMFLVGKCIQLPIQDENLFKILLEINPNILLGYTTENIKAYNKSVKEFKKERKNGI